MSEVKWIKIAANMFDNRKIKQIRKLPDGDAIIVIWLQILCLAGQINDGGFVNFTKDIPYTEEMLATEFDRPVNTIRLALITFERYNMIEIVDNFLMVSNWEKYQSVDKLETIKEQNRIRQQKYKDKHRLLQQGNVEVTLPVTPSHAIDIDKDKELDIDKEKKKKGVSFVDYTDNPNLISALNDFLSMRKTIKSPMTDKAITLILNGLDKLADDDQTKIDILNQSIMNGWKGVFPLKDQPKTGQQRVPKGIQELQEYKRQLQEQQRGEGNGRI